ncbi:hypothetical protein [Marinobacter sp. P4B1]|uniref:hypothetical protein n=1 Tax=Marinobacter sp. P4B1 TaxID=1119533 RepID=UPI00071D0BAE|nr:hypothetical protein [Marinobacter sp. P4B1]KRW81684.1 hypothetical protein AQ621_05505 [Marinobacter sp. P4B1]
MNGTLRWLLACAVVMELVAICLQSKALSASAGLVFILVFVLGAMRLQVYARTLFLLSLTFSAGLFVTGRLGMDGAFDALSDAAFYSAFLGSLGMMQCLVRRFEVLRRIHDVLLGGRVSLLYPKYAAVSCGIASVLSFGMMSLLCGTLADSLKERGIEGAARLQWLRSVLISALRGFALVPLVAPTSVAVAILTRELPQLSWSSLLPFGFVAALLMIVVGWVLERQRFREISSERVALDGWPAGTGKLVVLVLVVFACMGLLVALAGVKVSVAAMLAVPAVTLAYMLWQERSPGATVAEGVGQLAVMSNEMAIFAGSAMLGVSIATVVPADLFDGLVVSGWGSYLIAAAGLLIMPLFSMAGVIPITVLSVQSGMLAQLVASGADPMLVAIGLVIGFSLAMMVSPFGPSVMLLSRFGQVSRNVVAFQWNGVFVLLVVPLLLLLLAVFAVILPAPG